MNWTLLLFLLFVTLFPFKSLADIYRYEDDQGVVHFTEMSTPRKYVVYPRDIPPHKPSVVKNWFAIKSDNVCTPEEAPASLLSIKSESMKCKVVDETIKNKKPVVVKISCNLDGYKYVTTFYRTEELCLKELKRQRYKRNPEEKKRDAYLERYK